MPTNTLTDAQVRSAKPSDKAQKLFDGGGLHLWVSPKGAKVWRLAYRLQGTPKTISLGAYPAVGLAEARRQREAIKEQLRTGGDPMAPRKVEKASLLFSAACNTYWDTRQDVSDGYRVNAVNGLAMHLGPKLGALPIRSITRAQLLEALDAMDTAGLTSYVRKVRMWASQVFDWAVERGECDINPAALINPKKAFSQHEVEHFASIELRDVPAFMQRLALEDELQSVLACRLLALTWTRTNELRRAQWTQIEGDVWRVPGAQMKKRREHLVPLSRQALAILDKLRARSRGSVYVFPGARTSKRPMSENTVLALLARMGYRNAMTGHGWRTMASTWANEAGWREDAIERQLAHVPGDKTRATYNQAKYLPERREMLQAWADWLDVQTSVKVMTPPSQEA